MNPQQMMLLRGAQGLPQAPQHPQVQVPSGGMMMPQVGGTTPYKPGPAEVLMDGLGKFINGYQQTKEQQKQQAASELQRDLQLLSLGVPVDQKKTLKRMKQAGIEIDIEGGHMGAPQTGINGMPSPGMMPAPDPMQAPSQGMPQPQMPQPMPQQQGGLWDKMKGMVGMGPQAQPSLDSPGGQWLQQFAQRGQQQMAREDRKGALEDATTSTEMQRLQVIQGVLAGDPKAMQLGYKLGIAKQTPYDEVKAIAESLNIPGMTPETVGAQYLGMVLGMDKVKAQMMSMAEKLAPNFGGDFAAASKYIGDLYTTGKSDLKPGRTLDEAIKVREQAVKMQELYPTMPSNIANIYAEAVANGNKELVKKLDEVIGSKDEKTGMPNFLTSKTIDNMFKQQDVLNDKERLRQGWTGLDQGQQRIAQGWKVHNDNFTLGMINQIRTASNQEFDNAYRLWASKDATPEQKGAALRMMASSTQKMEPIEMTVDGKKMTFAPQKLQVKDIGHMFSFLHDEDDGYLSGVGETATGKEGQPSTVGTPLQTFMTEMMKKSVMGKPPITVFGPMGF